MLAAAAQHVYTWDWTLWFEITSAVIVALLVVWAFHKVVN